MGNKEQIFGSESNCNGELWVPYTTYEQLLFSET
jgi:hypothetical protein